MFIETIKYYYNKSLAVLPQACLCKRVVLVVFVVSVHARAFHEIRENTAYFTVLLR